LASADSGYFQQDLPFSASRGLRGDLTIAQASQSFSDVPSEHWAISYIQSLAARGIITGDAHGNFRPDAPMTRAEVAALLSQAFSPSPLQESASFSDVRTSYWAHGVIQEANAAGFLNGDSDDLFRPHRQVTRSEVLLALVSGLAYEPAQPYLETVSFYRDGYTVPVWMIEAIGAATEQQLVVNYPDVRELNLEQTATRAEVAAMVYQALVSQGSMPALGSDYIPSLTPEPIALADLEDVCEDSDIENYIRELREYGEVDKGAEEPFGWWTASQELATLEFKSISYRLLINCGENAVSRLVRELEIHDSDYPISSRPEFVSYYLIVLSALVQIGEDVVPALTSMLENPNSDIDSSYSIAGEMPENYQHGLALYIASAIGPEAEDIIPTLIQMVQSEEYEYFYLDRDSLEFRYQTHEYKTSAYEALLAIGFSSSDDTDGVVKIALDNALTEAINNSNVESVQRIAMLLHELGYSNDIAIDFLIDFLENPEADPLGRGFVAVTLAQMKASPSRVIPFLIKQIQQAARQIDRDPSQIRNSHYSIVYLVSALGIYGDLASDSVEILGELVLILEKMDEINGDFYLFKDIAMEAIVALGNIGFSDLETITLINQTIGDMPWLYDKNATVVFGYGDVVIPCAAATALSQQGEDIATVAMGNSNLPSHEDVEVRVLATHVIANFRPNMLSKLATELSTVGSDTDPGYLISGCYAIRNRESERLQLPFLSNAVPYLVDGLNSANEPLRTFSAYALAGISDIGDSDTDYVSALVDALKTGDESTRIAAALALDLIGIDAQSASDDLLIALGDESFEVRVAAASALFGVNTSSELPYGIRVYGGGDWLEVFDAIERFFEGR
jgi:hypothetical protein